ncbi:MAG: hypothetical protein HY762_04595 [Planctomycetes bacterium]|nr:hypothetical protein [Planctomycetota bacterium]
MSINSIELVDASAIPGPIYEILTAAPSQYVFPNIYRIIASPSVNFPPATSVILTFKYDTNIAGEVNQLVVRRWDETLVPPAWVNPPQRLDLANKQIIAELTSLSLFALFSGADTTPPVISITSPTDGKEYYNLTNGQPTIIPITYLAEDPVIDEVTSGINYTSVTLNGQVYTQDTIDLSNLLGENILTITAIDGSGNVAHKTVRFRVILPALVTVKPESLNINPGIMTVFIQFPAGYDVAGITDATCDGAKYERMELSDDKTTMVIKFRRQAVEAALAAKGEQIDTEFIVRGRFNNGASCDFEGKDSITKIVSEEPAQTTTEQPSDPATTQPPPPADSGSNGNNKGGKKK